MPAKDPCSFLNCEWTRHSACQSLFKKLFVNDIQYSVADGRFHGRKVDVNGGGLPIGEPSLMSCTRLG